MKKLSNFLAATALLVAVGNASAADQAIRIGYQNEPDPSHAAIVASDYEKALGAKIDWRKFDSGASVIAALASGSIDIGYAGSSPLAARPGRRWPRPIESRRRAQAGAGLAPSDVQFGSDHPAGGLLQPGHSPNSSTVWPTSVKPASAATCSAQRSTARPSTSTLRPQVRQVR